MPATSIVKERVALRQAQDNLQFPAASTLTEAVAGFSNYFWPGRIFTTEGTERRIFGTLIYAHLH